MWQFEPARQYPWMAPDGRGAGRDDLRWPLSFFFWLAALVLGASGVIALIWEQEGFAVWSTVLGAACAAGAQFVSPKPLKR